jgi:uncharacterized membrane protein YhaH (DUF805 family)
MVLPLKRYADFTGRARRKEYWLFYLFQMLVYVVAVQGSFPHCDGAPSAPRCLVRAGC